MQPTLKHTVSKSEQNSAQNKFLHILFLNISKNTTMENWSRLRIWNIFTWKIKLQKIIQVTLTPIHHLNIEMYLKVEHQPVTRDIDTASTSLRADQVMAELNQGELEHKCQNTPSQKSKPNVFPLFQHPNYNLTYDCITNWTQGWRAPLGTCSPFWETHAEKHLKFIWHMCYTYLCWTASRYSLRR